MVFVCVIQNATWSFRKVRQFCPCQSFGSSFIQSNLVADSQLCNRLLNNKNNKWYVHFLPSLKPGWVKSIIMIIKLMFWIITIFFLVSNKKTFTKSRLQTIGLQCHYDPRSSCRSCDHREVRELWLRSTIGLHTWYIKYIWLSYLMYQILNMRRELCTMIWKICENFSIWMNDSTDSLSFEVHCEWVYSFGKNYVIFLPCEMNEYDSIEQ